MDAVKHGVLLAPVSSVRIDELKELANSEARAAEQCGANAVMHAWNAGKYLCQAKEEVGHGNFGNWLRDNWERDERTAERYMELAKLNSSRMSDLTSISEALRICQKEAKPRVREKVLDYIRENPGCTDAQIAEATEVKLCSVIGRRNELCKEGLVQKTGSTPSDGGRSASTYVAVEQSQVEVEPEENSGHVSLSEALRAASRRNSVDAGYLAAKTGIAKSKIQAWLELSAEAHAYKAVQQDDKTFAIHRQRIKSDSQLVKSVKSQSIHGDFTPAEHLSSKLDSITNQIEGVVSLYSQGCKDFSAWNRLTDDDRKNLRFLLSSAQAKVEKHFPFFLGLVSE